MSVISDKINQKKAYQEIPRAFIVHPAVWLSPGTDLEVGKGASFLAPELEVV